MKHTLPSILIFVTFVGPLAAQVVDASVCDILADPPSFDGKLVRIKGTVVAGFDDFAISGSGCKQGAGAIWLAYPEGSKAKSGPAASLRLQLARNNPATVTEPNRAGVKLNKNKDFKQFDAALSTPYKAGGMCLGCVRYSAVATLTGRLDGVKAAGLVRDKDGKSVDVQGFGNLNRYRARLVLQSVSDVALQEIDYSQSAAASKDEVPGESVGGDPVAAVHRIARAFGAGSSAAEQVERAAAAYGKEGEDNGVEVGFGVPNEVPKQDGGKGQMNSPDGLLFRCLFDMDRLKGDALTRAISHTGAHIADIREQRPSAVATSPYELEYHAWLTTVLSAIGARQKTLTLPGGYLAWSTAWPDAERVKMTGDAISKFLSVRESLEGSTRP